MAHITPHDLMNDLGRRYQHGVNDLHPDGTRKRNLIQIVEWMNTIIVNGFEGGTLRKVPPTNSGSGPRPPFGCV
jgi:hypothetical protein